MTKDMIKKSLVIVALVAATQMVSAQVTDSVTTVEVKDTDKYRVETNRFGSNWFIGGGIGGQVYFGDHDKQMKFGDRITPTFGIYGGKWFTPGLGLRVGAAYSKIKGVSGWDNHAAKNGWNINRGNYNGFIKETNGQPEQYTNTDHPYPLYKTEAKTIHFTGDVLFNLSQMILGYKADRFYSFVPYVGVGFAFTTNKALSGRASHEVTGSVGLLNQFRLSSAWHLNLDVRATYTGDHFDQEDVSVQKNGHLASQAGRWGEGMLSASVGVSYNFTKRHWDRSTHTVTRINENVLNDLRGRVADLQNTNDDLRRQLEAALNREVTSENVAAQPLLVTFPIDRWTLSKKDRVNLGFLAETLKANPKMTYTIVGFADEGTGSSKRNVFLSRKRSEVVYNCLVNEFGVSEAQLKKEFKGGVGNMYYNDPRLSRAVLTQVSE